MRLRDTGVRARRLGLGAAVLVLASCLGVTSLTGCSNSPAAAKSAAAKGTATAIASPALAGVPRPGAPPLARLEGPPLPPSPAPLPVAPGAGKLRQTNAFPSTKTTAFHNAIHDLWLAVTTGNAGLARPAFFPEAAYTQIKAIGDPQYDWQYRLWYDFTLDVKAVHAILARNAKLARLIVPTQYAAWVYPGGCYNNVGYWHLPGARVVYRQGSETRSFGIASLISWRGEWYVIHFGAVLRGGGYGEVDDPETGPGVPGPPGGC